MRHEEALDCPCKPVYRQQVGGGRVLVHRRGDEGEGRETPSNRAMDRYCRLCGTWHIVGHEHLDRLHEIGQAFAVYMTSLSDVPDEQYNHRAVAWLRGR